MAATQSNLIDETWIRQNTSISDHVDIKLITPFIPISQDMLYGGCKGLFGDDLYNRLKQGNLDGNLSTNEIYLLELGRPALAWYICHLAVGEIATQIRGAGVGRTKNDNFESASKEEVDSKAFKYKNFADFYSQKVIEYLKNNYALYPQYTLNSPKLYEGGIFFGSKGRRGKCCR